LHDGNDEYGNGASSDDVQLLEHENVWKMEKLPKPIIVNQAWLRRGMV
jgi:hypothetical protein